MHGIANFGKIEADAWRGLGEPVGSPKKMGDPKVLLTSASSKNPLTYVGVRPRKVSPSERGPKIGMYGVTLASRLGFENLRNSVASDQKVLCRRRQRRERRLCVTRPIQFVLRFNRSHRSRSNACCDRRRLLGQNPSVGNRIVLSAYR